MSQDDMRRSSSTGAHRDKGRRRLLAIGLGLAVAWIGLLYGALLWFLRLED
jgi:hypothetical protein